MWNLSVQRKYTPHLRNQFPTVEEFGDGIESGCCHVHDENGLIFRSRRFSAACRAARLRQEFITSYTPEQNGIVERFFRSLKEKCVWQHNNIRGQVAGSGLLLNRSSSIVKHLARPVVPSHLSGRRSQSPR